MHLSKIGWCPSLLLAGKKQVTSEYPSAGRDQKMLRS